MRRSGSGNATARTFASCTAMHRVYPHGVSWAIRTSGPSRRTRVSPVSSADLARFATDDAWSVVVEVGERGLVRTQGEARALQPREFDREPELQALVDALVADGDRAVVGEALSILCRAAPAGDRGRSARVSPPPLRSRPGHVPGTGSASCTSISQPPGMFRVERTAEVDHPVTDLRGQRVPLAHHGLHLLRVRLRRRRGAPGEGGEALERRSASAAGVTSSANEPRRVRRARRPRPAAT